jgi:microcystin-dependent protein
MSIEPFIGEIKLFGFNFSPRGYAFCDGSVLSIAQYSALFSLLGTQFGGNGQTTFNLPDLRGRVPIGQGPGPGLSNYTIGQTTGTENTTLTAANLPAHTHTAILNVNNTAANVAVPVAGNSLAAAIDINGDTGSIYKAAAPNTALANGSVTVGATGAGQSFSNVQPSLVLNYSIAIEGIYPSRN